MQLQDLSPKKDGRCVPVRKPVQIFDVVTPVFGNCALRGSSTTKSVALILRSFLLETSERSICRGVISVREMTFFAHMLVKFKSS